MLQVGQGLMRPVNTSDLTARQYLRERTHAAHVQLNRHPLIEGITRDHYPLADYGRLLSAYFRFYQAIERPLLRQLALSDVLPDLPTREKSPWLAEDLGALGLTASLPVWEITGLPSATDALPYWLGVMYPLEGAMLGGRVVSAALAKRGILPINGGRFFAGYGEDVFSKWGSFEAILNAHLLSEADRQIAADQALAVFDGLLAILATA